MKFVKITMATLVLTALTCCVSVFATMKVYTVTLKALNLETTLGPQTKQTTSMQYYKNSGVVNNCTANYNELKARVYSEDGGNSDWITISHKATSGWNNDSKTNVPRAYNIKLKNATTTPCTAEHSGIWYLDY